MRRHFANCLIGCFTTAIASFAIAPPANAGTSGAANLGGSYYLSWSFLDRPSGQVLGYACITRDALQGMPRTISIDRYEIRQALIDQNSYPYLEPLNGISIQQEGRNLIARGSDPVPEDGFTDRLELNAFGNWYASEMPVDELGQACINSGIAGATEVIERKYNMTVIRQRQ